MSTTAPTSPAVVRTPSSRHQQSFNNPADRPHRTQSTASRSTAQPPTSPHRSHSISQHTRGSSTSQRGDLINVARRDFEQSNVAQPSTSRRSTSRDPPAVPTPTRADSMRSHQRSSSRSGPPRYADAVAANPSNINGVAAENGRRPATGAGASQQGRRRTTVEAPTGQWHLGKTIGAGSMGKVKLAKNVETGEQVAVKIVPRQSTDEHRSEQDRQRADHSKEIRTAREAAIVSLVNHPYICGMRDFVRTNYHWYMLFEYVNGGQMLDYIISHGRLKEKQARKFGRQIASALDYCHRNSIVHRDLKIENILISKTGDIKIIDFGLSNLFAPKGHLKTFCGSLYFAAPELLQAKQYTGPEVDIWSFGIVLYVLVCGKVPFDDQSMPQLHAKIKKGVVDYPPWLSAECKNLISRMLVTDPRQRATLGEIMNHPWITKGFNTPPENFLPVREPLRLPLDPKVIEGMHGFDFGTTDYIAAKLTEILTSDDYQHALRAYTRKHQAHTPEAERKRGVFDFYKRRNSTTSRDTLTGPSAEAIQLGADPINAYNPLISIYYLVREKQERERAEANPGALALPKTAPSEKPFNLPELQAPAAAYTNASAYEMPGEKPTGGRSRPRARTHGEDEITEGVQRLKVDAAGGPVSPAIITPPSEQTPAKKESAAAGLLRRFSTRRHKDPERERTSNLTPPALAVSGPGDGAGTPAAPPRKSFSVRRTRERSVPSSTNLPPEEAPQNESGLLSPPGAGSSAARKLKGLGRSASVNSAELRRRMSRRGTSEGSPRPPPPTSGSDKSSIREERARQDDAAVSDDPTASTRAHAPTSRTRSLGHARRESIQARRARREQARELNVPEETDQELATEAEGGETTSPENMKPVYLKGLFSVSTTSNKPLAFIRQDIIRVLRQLGVEYTEIKGGFSCRHSPSIDLNKNAEANPPLSPSQLPTSGGHHRRKISFGGFMGGAQDRDREEFREQTNRPNPSTPRSTRHRHAPERSYTNSEESDESVGGQENIHRGDEGRPRVPGETTTHVQNDLGGNMVLKFEIFIVKVPLLSLHGIQFKKVDGGTWQYKNMAQKILDELRL